MRASILWLACCAAVLTSFAASADQTQQAAPAQPAALAQPIANVSDSNRVVCHLAFHEGMLIRAHMCRTQREWDTIRRDGQMDLEMFQQRSLTANTP
jgi:hypothetical protein